MGKLRKIILYSMAGRWREGGTKELVLETSQLSGQKMTPHQREQAAPGAPKISTGLDRCTAGVRSF
jgi:hypothetical protein